jgi:DNA-binding response OmpR family regulator
VSVVALELEPGEATTISAALGGAGFQVVVQPYRVGEHSFDVVIVGTSRSRGSALARCEQLRASGYGGAIVVIGPADTEGDDVQVLDHGADDFLARPVRAQLLVARVRAVLRRVGERARLERGPLSIDRGLRVVYLRGKPLALTAREYALISRLAEAGGRTLTRDDLLTAVWGLRVRTTSNLVEVNLSRLRDKLGPDALLVETVRRGGYRLRW